MAPVREIQNDYYPSARPARDVVPRGASCRVRVAADMTRAVITDSSKLTCSGAKLPVIVLTKALSKLKLETRDWVFFVAIMRRKNYIIFFTLFIFTYYSYL